jgi:hypothetical protein
MGHYLEGNGLEVDGVKFSLWMPGNFEQPEALSKKDFELLEADTQKFLKLMKQGNFGDARLVANSLESATYVLDPVWVKGYYARQGGKI